MDPIERVQSLFLASSELKKNSAEVLAPAIARAAEMLFSCIISGGKILACGNGGSAADAQHFASELVNRFEQDRPGLPAISLVTDTSLLTSVANDLDYTQVFSRQVEALGKAKDMLIAITTSGNSANIIKAIQSAQERDLSVILLTGETGGRAAPLLREEDDLMLAVPSRSTARVQEVHILIVHCLCDLIDRKLLG